MPYKTTEELPKNIRAKYSEKAQAVYMETFNSIVAKTKDESRAFAAAASAANKVDGIASVVEAEVVAVDREFVEASFNFDGSFSEAPTFDDEKGVYKIPVTLIKPGVSKNKVYFSEAWVAKLVDKMQDARAFINHPRKSEIKDRPGRNVNEMAGWYENVHQDTDMSARATLNLVETPLTEHVIKLAKANPKIVGLSINAKGKAGRGKVNGENVMIAETVEKAYSTDIVNEASAGGELMQFVAAVPMDIEQPEVNMEEANMEDEIKSQAAWLLAESQYKADVTAWLTVEKAHKEIEAARVAQVTEAKLAEVPEKWKEHLKGQAPEQIDSFMEVLKQDFPDVKNYPAATPKPEKQPGEEGYQRHFFS